VTDFLNPPQTAVKVKVVAHHPSALFGFPSRKNGGFQVEITATILLSILNSDIKASTDRLIEDRTAFVIAHRLSTIRDADRIVVRTTSPPGSSG
jgi:hypothetical protein